MRRKKYKRKRNKRYRQQTLKKATAVFLLVMVFTLGLSLCGEKNVMNSGNEVRGVWVSYIDYGKLGLTNKSEADFRENARAFYERADELEINTVFFHVRAFRDAAYLSEHFPVSRHLWNGNGDIPYDPLAIMIELAHDYDMELHAWMNPYRNSSAAQEILDPGNKDTTEEIVLCVEELLQKYDIDGIHFDDYFYPENSVLEDGEKMENVNAMVRTVYKTVHRLDSKAVFGISPAGNVSYSKSIGADVKTWLSEEGYVDYIIPQIYWTDEHIAAWRDDMFSDTVDEWISMNSNDIPLYIGLALYKVSTGDAADPGWNNSSSNICFQIEQLRDKECDGYVFFSAADLFEYGAETELKNYQNLEF